MKKLIFGSLLILSIATFTACGDENTSNQGNSENISEDLDSVQTDTTIETDTVTVNQEGDSSKVDKPETDTLENAESDSNATDA